MTINIKSGLVPLFFGIILLISCVPNLFSMVQELYYEMRYGHLYDVETLNIENESYYIVDNGDLGIESRGELFVASEHQFPGTPSPDIKLLDMHLKRTNNTGTYSILYGYGDHIIRLEDSFSVDKVSTSVEFPNTVSASVKIMIDGKEFANSSPTSIDPIEIGDARYPIKLLHAKNRETDKKYALLIQPIGDETNLDQVRWRFYWIPKNGEIIIEEFNNAERKKKPYRTALLHASSVSALPYGFEWLHNYPLGFLYIYPPFTNLTLGILLTIFGLIRMAMQK